MAVTAIKKADLSFCTRQLTLGLGIAAQSAPDGSLIAAGAPYSSGDLAERLGLADQMICEAIVRNPAHPFRPEFITDETGWLPNAGLIPAHLGDSALCTITNNLGGTEETYKTGRRAQSLFHIQKVQKNPSLYNYPNDLYFVHAGRVYLGRISATTRAKFDIPNINIVRTSGVVSELRAPQIYTWGIIAAAITLAAPKGFDQSHRSYWATFWQICEQKITNGELSVPVPDRLARLGT